MLIWVGVLDVLLRYPASGEGGGIEGWKEGRVKGRKTCSHFWWLNKGVEKRIRLVLSGRDFLALFFFMALAFLDISYHNNSLI